MVTVGAAARPLAKRKHRAEVLRHGLEHPGCQSTPRLNRVQFGKAVMGWTPPDGIQVPRWRC